MEGFNFHLPDDIMFALDIGTRSVVGIIGRLEGEVFKIIDFEESEHPERAMYDGQVHDIDKVAGTIKIVKEKLEKRHNCELRYVSIAAAGRTLKTHKVYVEIQVDPFHEITKSHIDSLEIEGTQRAQREISETDDFVENKYFCVGYSVVNYFLDGKIISNLKGHKGNAIGAEIIATFLPRVVIDSLYTVIQRVGLEAVNLTLEPIAAINIAIPPKYRLLNLALVDIGAGTSDIAITKDGVINAYSMVDIAGDEITEALSKAFLLDFVTAENLKIRLSQQDTHKFNDILGITHEKTTDEILEAINDAIENLCNKITERILQANGKAPSAVFCIGGGSQVPGLTTTLAKCLGLPKERVVIRETQSLENISFDCKALEGPKYITPIGIGLISLKDSKVNFINVFVNERKIRLFKSKELTVTDALIMVDYDPRRLLPRKGKDINFLLNGEKKRFHGEYGEAAKIFVNNIEASLETKLKDNDVIVIQPGQEGKSPEVYLRDVLDSYEVILNGKAFNIVTDYTVNGVKVGKDYVIKDGDMIEISFIENVNQLAEKLSIDSKCVNIVINGNKAAPYLKIRPGDSIFIEEKEEKTENDKSQYIVVKVNGEYIKLDKEKDKDPIFVDIFKYIDLDLKKVKGLVTLKLNGERASYTDRLKDNDVIEIYWQ